MRNHKLKVLPYGIELAVPQGTTVMKALIEAGIYIEGPCGGRGTCGKCKIELAEGSLDEKDQKWKTVLACRQEVVQDLVIKVPEVRLDENRKSLLHIKLSGQKRQNRVQKIALKIPQPTIENPVSDQERLWSVLSTGVFYPRHYRALRNLPEILRQSKHEVTVVTRWSEVVAIEPGDTTQKLYGVAFDIGTTTLVGSLIDLNKGDVVATHSEGNPQRVFGADVISRISYVDAEEKGLETLQGKVIEALNGIIEKLTREAGITPEDVYEVSVVGNTTMIHLFLGINPSYLAQAPYVPPLKSVADVRAAELGLKINPAGYCIVVPIIAGFVGADTVSVILTTGMDKAKKLTLAIDIGTNGEIVLGSEQELLSCSTAAGPAFEGAQIKFGMRAAPGAIERVEISDDVKIQTIGGQPPVGICGSGLIDAVAEMLKVGVLDYTGRIVDPSTADLPPKIRERIKEGEHGFDFVLAFKDQTNLDEDLVLTQKDVRELQLAKGAIYAGIQMLLEEMKMTVDDIEEVLLAGAFGTYIRKESAWRIGLVPNLDLDRIRAVGNAAGVGSQMVLISEEARQTAYEIADKTKYIELCAKPEFQNKFMESIYFPQYKD